MKKKQAACAAGKVHVVGRVKSKREAPRYDLIPRSLMERLAARFARGAKKYGDLTYLDGVRDRAYILDRMNHMQEHMQAQLAPQTFEEYADDNLGAIAWAAAFLSEVSADAEGAVILEEIRRERGAF